MNIAMYTNCKIFHSYTLEIQIVMGAVRGAEFNMNIAFGSCDGILQHERKGAASVSCSWYGGNDSKARCKSSRCDDSCCIVAGEMVQILRKSK